MEAKTLKTILTRSLQLLMVAGGTVVGLICVVLIIIFYPRTAFKRNKRDIPPACLLDSSLGSHHYVTANGIKFHYVAAGDSSKPLLLLLHGFPEFWFSWRHQLKGLSKHYYVVAIDMRGYGDSEKPPNKWDYRMDLLIRDIAELIPALGYSSCILGAHDWGGGVAWSVAQKYPELVDRLIIMDCPHFKVFASFLKRNCRQLLKSWYVFMFQVPKLPEFLMGLKDLFFIKTTFIGKQGGVINKASFPPDIMEAYKYTFSKVGALTGPINYYRCISHIESSMKPYSNKKISVPTLLIWGDNDAFLSREMADNHEHVCADITVRHIPNCSHWVQQEAPDLCNKFIVEFLSSKAEM